MSEMLVKADKRSIVVLSDLTQQYESHARISKRPTTSICIARSNEDGSELDIESASFLIESTSYSRRYKAVVILGRIDDDKVIVHFYDNRRVMPRIYPRE